MLTRLNILFYLIPILPFYRAIKDRNKRFYLLIESPFIGLFITPISLLTTLWLNQLPLKIDYYFWRNCLEVYLGYQSASIIRNGVNLDHHLSKKQKVSLNWFYSVLIYTVVTTADYYYLAQTKQELLYAQALTLFACLWPILSQTFATYLMVPILFEHFPNRSFLEKIKQQQGRLQLYLKERETVLTSFSTAEKSKQLLATTKQHQTEIWWLKQFIRLSSADSKLSLSKAFFAYWVIKYVVTLLFAIVMISLYFTLRWWLVGPNLAQADGFFIQLFQLIS